MAARFHSERNLKFLLYEVFDTESLTAYSYYQDNNRKFFDMVIKEAFQLAKNLLWPVFTEMDRHPPEFENGRIKVHPTVKKMMREFGEGGWLTSKVPANQGGEQMPHIIAVACDFIFASANYSANAYQSLTAKAANLIRTFSDKKLVDTFVPQMDAGQWQGTMTLTEPEAGSSLADIVTTAEFANNGIYRIKGQKIFISAGDHDGVENVVHMLLAKIKGAPPGVKGISLFLVPKYRPDDTGGLVPNDVITSGMYHKLGYRGCPIVQLNFGDQDDCRGWLVGEPNMGLKYMFQMMNESRITVGMGATAMATAAYYAALDYTKTRCQGRCVTEKDPLKPQIPIIEHADVKRMLLFQRSVIEGSLSLILQSSLYVDRQKVTTGEKKDEYRLLLEILTPVIKSYPSEMGILAISQGLQCFGGSGYCDDYPLEQYYRDARIHPIHEGTTGIQGMDLLGRKILMQNGRAYELFLTEVKKAITDAGEFPALTAYAGMLEASIEKLISVTSYLRDHVRDQGADHYLADATLYLEFFGIITIAWQWLKQGVAVQKGLNNMCKPADKNFFMGKMYALQYFFGYELPKINGLIVQLMAEKRLTCEMTTEHFAD